MLLYLDLANHAGGVHPAGHVDGVPPDVVLGLLGSDDPGHDGTNVDSDSDLEIVERVLINVVELFPYSDRVARHCLHVIIADRGALISET